MAQNLSNVNMDGCASLSAVYDTVRNLEKGIIGNVLDYGQCDSFQFVMFILHSHMRRFQRAFESFQCGPRIAITAAGGTVKLYRSVEH